MKRRTFLTLLATAPAALAGDYDDARAGADLLPWYVGQQWRDDPDQDAHQAERARLQLGRLHLYPLPTKPISDAHRALIDRTRPRVMASQRAAISELIDELAEDDLRAVFDTVRLLAQFPRRGGVS